MRFMMDNTNFGISLALAEKLMIGQLNGSEKLQDDSSIELLDSFKRPSLNGKHLKVLMLEYPPFLYIDKQANGTVSYRGICWDLLTTVAKALNFTFNLTQSKDGKWGNKDPERGWFGIQGEVFRGEADLGMPITITPERTEEFDFSFSFWQEPCGVTVRLETDDSPDLWFLRPISPPVWYTLIAVWVVTIVCLWGMPLLSHKRIIHPTHKEQRASLAQCSWYSFGVLVMQGGTNYDNSVWRCVAGGWWFLSVVLLYGVYVGNLVAFLSTTKYAPPFNSLADMVNQDQFVYGTETGIFIEQLFKDSKSGIYKQIGQYMSSQPHSFSNTTVSGIGRSRSENYAFIGEKSVLDASTVDMCDLTLIQEEFYTGRWAFIMRQGWKYKAELDEAVMNIVEGGLMDKWKVIHWPRSYCRGQGTYAEVNKVTLKGFVTVFVLLASGIGIASLILLSELVLYKLVQLGLFKQRALLFQK